MNTGDVININKEEIQGAVMVVGGGVTGIQTALDLADSGFLVYLVEKSPAIGGMMSWLDKTFPTNDCAMCILSPKLVEVGRHLNIDILSHTEIRSVDGEAGNFQVTVDHHARFIDPDVCTGCGECAAHCPVSAIDAYNQGMRDRRAIYIDYPQAVPLSFSIDPDACIGCGLCDHMCLARAIRYNDQPENRVLNVGAIILCVGTEAYDPSELDFLGYGKTPNVVTSAEFERILSASGPYRGHLMRPLDREEPKKIAWLQCVGSRDINRSQNAHCSSVCCMYAIKEAIIAKEHATDELDCAVFYMDMRTYGKDFERCYNQARDHEGVRFIRSRVHTVEAVPETGDLMLQYFDEDARLKNEVFNLVVLSVGLRVSTAVTDLANRLGIDLMDGNFCRTATFRPVATSRDGIFVSGAFQGPKDIPSSVVDASAAAASAGEILHPARHSQTRTKETVPEENVPGDRPRIGVFVCKCGSNIAGVVDVPAVREYAASLPYVDFADDNLYTCSQNTQEDMTRIIKEKGLNRVVVASCSPKTHDPLFKETLINAGLNKYLFSMANIRNLCSWVHKDDPAAATQKAKDLVRMAVAGVAFQEPLAEEELTVAQSALVIGGGVAGMTAALSLARQGQETHLLEQAGVLGGQARHLYRTYKNEDIQAGLQALIAEVAAQPNITLHLESEITDVTGFVGSFKTTVRRQGAEETISHGVTVVATGAREHAPTEYLYGTDERIKTSLELDRILLTDPDLFKTVNCTIFIQCVGSREPERPYCSRVCCTHSIQNALTLKEINPAMDVYVLYRDIRTYGHREDVYNRARQAGVVFIRYTVNQKPQVSVQADGRLEVRVNERILNEEIAISPDLISLASALIPNDNESLARFYKLPLTEDGFFAERHVKLGPAEFAIDGLFLCGMAHYPKSIDESIAQGKASAARAVTVLAQQTIYASGETARVDATCCSGCGMCVSICPYAAPSFIEEGPQAGRARINPVLCKGCGLCAASCRSGAIALQGATMKQINEMIEAI